MEPAKRAMKVLCPVEGKNGRTYWMKLGRAFENRDGSTNVYLDGYPTNGKLQIREWDEQDEQRRNDRADGAPTGRGDERDDIPF